MRKVLFGIVCACVFVGGASAQNDFTQNSWLMFGFGYAPTYYSGEYQWIDFKTGDILETAHVSAIGHFGYVGGGGAFKYALITFGLGMYGGDNPWASAPDMPERNVQFHDFVSGRVGLGFRYPFGYHTKFVFSPVVLAEMRIPLWEALWIKGGIQLEFMRKDGRQSDLWDGFYIQLFYGTKLFGKSYTQVSYPHDNFNDAFPHTFSIMLGYIWPNLGLAPSRITGYGPGGPIRE